jgi:hypothetical protein
MPDLIEGGTDANVNFAYDDIASGTNVQTYYTFSKRTTDPTDRSQDTTYGLSTDSNVVTSDNNIEFNGSGTGWSACTGAVSDNEQNTVFTFDSGSFRLPRVVNGTAEASAKYTMSTQSGQSLYPQIEFFHFDGSTETSMGSVYLQRLDGQGGGGVNETSTGTVTLTRTKFRKNDILRIKVTGWGCSSASNYASTTMLIGTDTTEDLHIKVPFEVDV